MKKVVLLPLFFLIGVLSVGSTDYTCIDGTFNLECSFNKPLYCYNGGLYDNCKLCGCPSNQICGEDNSCRLGDRKIMEKGYSFVLNVATEKKVYNISEQVKLTDPPTITEKHPALLYTDLSIIKNRIKKGPYSSWWNEIKINSDNALNIETSSEDRRSRADLAKILAFTYTVTNENKYGDKARDFLFNMESGQDYVNYHAFSDGLGWYGQAYDMLKGSNYNFGSYTTEERKWYCVWACKVTETYDYDSEIRDKIQKESYKFSRDDSMTWECTKDVLSSLFRFSPDFNCVSEVGELLLADNNIRIRRYSSIGIAALSIINKEDKNYDIPENLDIFNLFYNNDASKIFEDSVEQVLDGVDNQVISDKEGGWAEGTYYLGYSARNYIPFLNARRNFDYSYPNNLEKVHEWSIKIRMPNGQRPNYDDAGFDYFFSGWLEGDGLYRWDWENSDVPYYSSDYVNLRVDSIAFFDDSVTASSPEFEPTQFLPETGNVVFRNEFTKEAIYMMLLGEHGRARRKGLSHEHPDATSFIIYAYGYPLALDSGYIRWEEHSKVNKAWNHNLILVDGQGPPITDVLGVVVPDVDVDSYIKDYFSSDNLDYAKVETSYEGANIDRNVFFPDHKYFVIVDDIKSSKNHNYDFLLHGNGGGTSGGIFTKTTNGGIWQYKNAKLMLYNIGADSINIGEDVHSFKYDQELTHKITLVRKRGENVKFLNILYPEQINKQFPDIKDLSIQNYYGSKIDDAYVFAKKDESNLDITTEIGRLESDAEILLLKVNDDKLDYFMQREGKNLKLNDQNIFSSNSEINLFLKIKDYNTDKYELGGYVKGEGDYVLDLYTKGKPSQILFNGIAVAYNYDSGKIKLYLNDGGDLIVRGIIENVTNETITKVAIDVNETNLSKSMIENTGLNNLECHLNLKLQIYDNGWRDYYVVYDKEKINLGPGERFALDREWNDKNIILDTPGRYRVYVELIDTNVLDVDLYEFEVK